MRLIDADELKKAFEDTVCIEPMPYAFVKQIIDNAPTVELFCSYLSDGEVRQPCVEAPCKYERPQGEWITTRTLKHDGNPYCSNCDEETIIRYNYCPNCGAQMLGGKKK